MIKNSFDQKNHIFFLSLGSNIEPRGFYLDTAIRKLSKLFDIVAKSSIYRTAPMLDLDQDDFHNMVIACSTDVIDPMTILSRTQGIENDIGRVKDSNRPKGPRIIDIDIVYMDGVNYHNDRLNIPHEGWCDRNFVLVPMLEVINKVKFDDYDVVKQLLVANIAKNKDQYIVKV